MHFECIGTNESYAHVSRHRPPETDLRPSSSRLHAVNSPAQAMRSARCSMPVCSIQALTFLAPSFLVKPQTPAPSWEACQGNDQAVTDTAAHALPLPQPLLNITATFLLSGKHQSTAFALSDCVPQDSALHANPTAQHDACAQSSTLLSSSATSAKSNAAAATPCASQTQSASPCQINTRLKAGAATPA